MSTQTRPFADVALRFGGRAELWNPEWMQGSKGAIKKHRMNAKRIWILHPLLVILREK